ncbi:hypothetical protein [Methanolobus bombayensis]|uniref:hypothetical protein n=1 Tax=Methanolobus bombayensis TaxID=38023 RepID=UPI001AE116CC|nr:hypothetical protein [Methanolobus bombayensis]MBP1910213.1 hypothetical protein [Methanolobus bombayensis]
MAENKKDEKVLTEKMENKDTRNLLLENTFYKPFDTETPVTPGFKIEFTPHKSAGLQNASDMWIDKDRLFEGVRDKKDIDKIRKLSGL